MAKTLGIILWVTMASIFSVTQQDTLTAEFDRVEDGMYYFTSEGQESHNFHGMEEAARAKYDLFENRYVGKTFTLSFITKVIEEENEDPIEEQIITDIKLIK